METAVQISIPNDPDLIQRQHILDALRAHNAKVIETSGKKNRAGLGRGREDNTHTPITDFALQLCKELSRKYECVEKPQRNFLTRLPTKCGLLKLEIKCEIRLVISYDIGRYFASKQRRFP